jgi:hypothetical protein
MIQVDGVSVKVDDCSHCKQKPSDDEVRVTVQKAQKMRACPQYRCGYCGETVKATAYRIYHDESGWNAMELEIEPAVSLRVQPQNAHEVYEHNGLHLRCVAKALPYLNGLAQK